MTSAVSIILECFGNAEEQFVPEARGSVVFGCVFPVSWPASMGNDFGKEERMPLTCAPEAKQNDLVVFLSTLIMPVRYAKPG